MQKNRILNADDNTNDIGFGPFPGGVLSLEAAAAPGVTGSLAIKARPRGTALAPVPIKNADGTAYSLTLTGDELRHLNLILGHDGNIVWELFVTPTSLNGDVYVRFGRADAGPGA